MDSATETPQPKKTIRVRILVAINPDGEWSAVGGTHYDGEEAKEYVYLDNMKEGEHYWWVEADVPLPNNEVQGVLAGEIAP